MELVDNSTFLKKLTDLFDKNNGAHNSSIWLTHKRFHHDEMSTMRSDDPVVVASDDSEYPCLIRCTNGQNSNFSTQVKPGELHRFHAAYGTLLKASMSGLRKRDKKKEKQRAEEAVLRKKKLFDPIRVDGPKRGNGRRKRVRKVKAALRQEELRKKHEAMESKTKAT